MAIAFVAAADGGNVATTTSNTYSYTCGSGSNRLLIVGVLGDVSSDLITGVTYAGVAMTLIDKQLVSNERWQYLFYLLAPATGANNVVITASGTCDFILSGAADYTGVKQTGQPDSSAKQNSGFNVTFLTTGITTVNDNCWSMLFEAGYNANAAPQASTNTTLRAVEATFGAWGLFDNNAAITPAGSFSQTTTRTTQSLGIGHTIGAFQPDTGGAAIFFGEAQRDLPSAYFLRGMMAHD